MYFLFFIYINSVSLNAFFYNLFILSVYTCTYTVLNVLIKHVWVRSWTFTKIKIDFTIPFYYQWNPRTCAPSNVKAMPLVEWIYNIIIRVFKSCCLYLSSVCSWCLDCCAIVYCVVLTLSLSSVNFVFVEWM